jgi:hypothetical protein
VPVQPEQVESVIVLRSSASHHLVKLRLTFGVEMDDFAVRYGMGRITAEIAAQSFGKLLYTVPLRDTNRHSPDSMCARAEPVVL